MSLITALALYFVIWWLCLFIVLPFGNRSQVDHGERVQGTDPGAPVLARLGRKLIAATVLAGIVLALVWWGLGNEWLRAYWR